ncbi:MAG: zinc-dependent metalloprotease, partial [Prevotellaceae bacterium]|nr:zinc-dependent metalloprotease [Prevotellaceae bacterium]
MKNRLLHFMYHFTARPALCLLCLLMATGFDAGRAPRSLNINHESSLRGFLAEKNGTLSKGLFPPEAIACRRFEHNRQLAEIGAADKGRLLLLDLFDDAQYSAVIDNVTVSFDGVRGITAKIVDDETAYCFISLSDAGLSMSIDIPRRDEQYLVSTKDGVSYLAKIRLSDMRKYDLSCTDADEHHHDDHADSGHYDAPPGALEADADDCTFPPDTLTDAVTINLLFVYTEAAEQYAAAHYTSIDNVIDQAMLRSNTVMANSLTNVTFTLAYKHKTDYTEVDSDADLERITDPGDGYMDEVHALRKEYRADLVVFMPLVDFTGGVAWLLNAYIPGNGRPTYGFALSRVQQSSWTYTVVHEIGHNMGCGHHWRQQIAPGPGLFDYSSGYRGQNAAAAWYSTVMTYEAGSNFPDGNTAPRIAFFSDPDIVHDGVVIGRADSANNALTIRQSKHAVA